jgi:hypothetical protein
LLVFAECKLSELEYVDDIDGEWQQHNIKHTIRLKQILCVKPIPIQLISYFLSLQPYSCMPSNNAESNESLMDNNNMSNTSTMLTFLSLQ